MNINHMRNTQFHKKAYRVTIYLSKTVLSLPMHPYLSESEIMFIVKSIAETLEK